MKSDPVVLALYLTGYALLHSFLAADRLKSAVNRALPSFSRWYRLTYTVISVITLYPLIPLMSGSPLLYRIDGAAALLMRLIQIAGLAGFAYSALAVDLRTFIGLRHPEADQEALAQDGPYRLCRHPLYFFGSVMLAASPEVTVAYAVFTVWTIAYFWIGSWFEERRLLATFGDAYHDYRSHVPHFIPLPRKRKSASP